MSSCLGPTLNAVERTGDRQTSPDGLGRTLTLLRKERGLSQTALARAIGVTFQQLQKYESGKNRLSASRLYRLASVLGVDVAAFFVGLPDLVQSDPV